MESQKSWTQIGNYTTKLLISIRGKKAIPTANIWIDITYDFSPLDMTVLIITIIPLSYSFQCNVKTIISCNNCKWKVTFKIVKKYF